MTRLVLAIALALAVAVPAFPKGSKTKGSKNGVVNVHSYKKKNGTVVQSHDRTAPDATDKNNWSTEGNVNPETGKRGTKRPKH